MNILLVTDLYPVKDSEAQTPKTLYNFVTEWEKSGHTVDIIKPNFIFNSFFRGKPFYKTDMYGKVYNVNYFTPFLFDVKKKLPEIKNYDVIIAHMPSGIIFSNKLSGKKICAVHCSDLAVLTNPIYKFYFKNELLKGYENSTAIACRSEALYRKFTQKCPQFAHKTFLAPSGIDEKIIFERKLNFNPEKIKILTCANLIPRKNIDKLIYATRGMKNIELTVIGDGKLRKRLEKIDDSVHFTGHLEHSKVLEKMRESDIFILPSISETFGMVYLEAMASGCITVGVENEGIDGIIKNGENGFLIKPQIDDIVKLLLIIKESDNEAIERIQNSAFQTVKSMTQSACGESYLKQILKNL